MSFRSWALGAEAFTRGGRDFLNKAAQRLQVASEGAGFLPLKAGGGPSAGEIRGRVDTEPRAGPIPVPVGFYSAFPPARHGDRDYQWHCGR